MDTDEDNGCNCHAHRTSVTHSCSLSVSDPLASSHDRSPMSSTLLLVSACGMKHAQMRLCCHVKSVRLVRQTIGSPLLPKSLLPVPRSPGTFSLRCCDSTVGIALSWTP